MLTDRLAYSAENCSIARALEDLGGKWTLLVLREAFYGVRRFDQIQQAVGCPRNVLSARLAALVQQGILETAPYRDEGQRARLEYRLTDKGRALLPILLALMRWGETWEPAADGPTVELRHRDCGAPLRVEISCEEGHRELGARDALAFPGAGAKLLEPAAPSR